MGMGWHREVYPAFCRKPDGEVMFSSIRCGKNASVSVPCLTGWWLWCAATVCTWRLSAPGRRRGREPAEVPTTWLRCPVPLTRLPTERERLARRSRIAQASMFEV